MDRFWNSLNWEQCCTGNKNVELKVMNSCSESKAAKEWGLVSCTGLSLGSQHAQKTSGREF